MFAIERAAMDRSGKVITRLDALLPAGQVLDVGAGDGYSGERLTRSDRSILALEPAAGMIDTTRELGWLRGDAAALPFAENAVDAAYATWAYFFPALHDVEPALADLRRVVRPGGVIAIVDNAGDDSFTAMTDHDIAAPLDSWRSFGFDVEIIDTAFEFDTMADASALLGLYFGDGAKPALEVPFRVAVMTTVV